MARDYKHRAQPKKKTSRPVRIGTWQWMLITALIISFVVFLVYIRMTGSKQPETAQPLPAATAEKKPLKPDLKKTQTPENKEKKAEPKAPHFEFYTVLPEKEVVVPEHEIKTRSREERVGKAKEGKYIMQAGSFGAFKEADQLRAKLALMGIESKVEKAKIGDKIWYRVKMGPYTQMTSVDLIKKRLKKNGIDAIVTEAGVKAKTPAATQPNH